VTRGALPKASKAFFRRPFCLAAFPWAHCGQIHAPGRLRPSNQPAAFARLRLPGCEPQSNHAVRELESWAGQSHERATASRSVPILKTLRPKAYPPKSTELRLWVSVSPTAQRGFLEEHHHGNAACVSVHAKFSKRQTAETRLTKPFCATPNGCRKRRLTSKLVMLTLPKDICFSCAREKARAARRCGLRPDWSAPEIDPPLCAIQDRDRHIFRPAVGSRCFGRCTCATI